MTMFEIKSCMCICLRGYGNIRRRIIKHHPSIIWCLWYIRQHALYNTWWWYEKIIRFLLNSCSPLLYHWNKFTSQQKISMHGKNKLCAWSYTIYKKVCMYIVNRYVPILNKFVFQMHFSTFIHVLCIKRLKYFN